MKTKLGERVEVEVDEARLARGWKGIEARAFVPARRVQPFALAIGGVVALAAAVALVVSGGATTSAPSALRAEGGPVAERFAALEAEGGAVRFDDHSQITLTNGTHLESLTNSGSEFRVLLHHGRARFEVEPGGPRRWIIEAGHASVEVIGTVFTVERRDGNVEVEVERGRVMVRSERLPEGLRILGARERASVRADDERSDAISSDAVSSDTVSSDAVATDAPERADAESVTPVALAPRAPDDERGSRTGSSVETDDAHRSAAELLTEADEARRAGDTERALALLARASERTGEPEAALASLTRARLLSTLHRANEAMIDLRRALDAGLPPALEESARYRLVSAVAASGDDAGAERAAQDYLRRYPEGSFRGEVLEHSSVLPAP